MTTQWIWDGTGYTFDISEAECISRISDVFAGRKELFPDDAALTPSQKAENICHAVRIFFSALFGDEKSRTICGVRQSAARCTEAYLDFISFLGRQIDEFSRIREAVEEKYAERAASLADGTGS